MVSCRPQVVPADPVALEFKERRRRSNDKSVGRFEGVSVIDRMVLLSKKRKGEHF
jgi:hypothetical protein